MAERIEGEYEWPGRRRKSTYNWELWANGDKWRLRRGEDFPADKSLGSVRSAVYAAAKRMGLTVRIGVEADDALVVQFSERE